MNLSLRTAPALLGALIAFNGSPNAQASQKDTRDRLALSATVMQEIMAAPDKGIPDDMLQNAHCAVIVPGMKKGAFIVSGQYGKGFITCRKKTGWSAPAAIRVEGGGVGFQIGGSETDVVMLVMNARGAERLMSSKFTVGADGEVAAGPVGRQASAQTDAKMTAEILSWSRSRGVFAGIALKGATLRADEDDNQDLYGKKLGTKEVIDSATAVPASGRPLINLLSKYSPHESHLRIPSQGSAGPPPPLASILHPRTSPIPGLYSSTNAKIRVQDSAHPPTQAAVPTIEEFVLGRSEYARQPNTSAAR